MYKIALEDIFPRVDGFVEPGVQALQLKQTSQKITEFLEKCELKAKKAYTDSNGKELEVTPLTVGKAQISYIDNGRGLWTLSVKRNNSRSVYSALDFTVEFWKIFASKLQEIADSKNGLEELLSESYAENKKLNKENKEYHILKRKMDEIEDEKYAFNSRTNSLQSKLHATESQLRINESASSTEIARLKGQCVIYAVSLGISFVILTWQVVVPAIKGFMITV